MIVYACMIWSDSADGFKVEKITKSEEYAREWVGTDPDKYYDKFEVED